MWSGRPCDLSRADSVGQETGTDANPSSKRNRSSSGSGSSSGDDLEPESQSHSSADDLEPESQSHACRVLETLIKSKSILWVERKDHVKSRLQSNSEKCEGQLRELKRLSGLRTTTSTTAIVTNAGGHHDSLKAEGVIANHFSVDLGLLAEEKNVCLLVRSRLALIRLNSEHLSSFPPDVEWPQICSKLKGANVDPRKVAFANCGSIKEVELKLVRPLPKYTTWTQVDRNECMTEDQSITRRRRISYEPNGHETFYRWDADDSQDEDTTAEDSLLSRADEIIFQKAVSRHGASAAVLEIIAEFLNTTVQTLEKKCLPTQVNGSRNSVNSSKRRFLGKHVHDRGAATRTISIWRPAFAEPITLKEGTAFCDIKFCRRCYKFDCKLHTDYHEIADSAREDVLLVPCAIPGHGERVVENVARTPCGRRCVYSFRDSTSGMPSASSSVTVAISCSKKTSGVINHEAGATVSASEFVKDGDHQRGGLLEAWLSRYSCVISSTATGGDGESRDKTVENHSISQLPNLGELQDDIGAADDAESSSEVRPFDQPVLASAGSTRIPGLKLSSPSTAIRWSRFEKELCEKGVQIFGRNSCRIGSMFSSSKSCADIADYLNKLSIEGPNGGGVLGTMASGFSISELTSSSASVFVRKRVRMKLGRKKVKVASKSSAWGAAANRRQMGRDGSVQDSYLQFKPCHCLSPLGCTKDCPCVASNQFCEKYCGCSKVCKNLFRGCFCAKSMCDGRRCLCVALGRECDPDLCKFCSVENGQSSSPNCCNMNILLQNKKNILLGNSEVCIGWGVFAGEAVCKNDYIGEYTGELISHEEANKRGRIYDRETSFLFNLNDKFVVDAFRKGSPLKFANHSSRKPNCYTKVLLVAGDHRVGIFAKEMIEAGKELLYDYQYEPDIAPPWAITDGDEE